MDDFPHRRHTDLGEGQHELLRRFPGRHSGTDSDEATCLRGYGPADRRGLSRLAQVGERYFLAAQGDADAAARWTG